MDFYIKLNQTNKYTSYVSCFQMNSYFTRFQQQILDSEPNYNTRLQSRIRTMINNEFEQNIAPINRPLYDVCIDFDEASRAWNANKRRVGQSYEYICGAKTCSGKPCQRKPIHGKNHCKTHS
jgi:hypothetical protein